MKTPELKKANVYLVELEDFLPLTPGYYWVEEGKNDYLKDSTGPFENAPQAAADAAAKGYQPVSASGWIPED